MKKYLLLDSTLIILILDILHNNIFYLFHLILNIKLFFYFNLYFFDYYIVLIFLYIIATNIIYVFMNIEMYIFSNKNMMFILLRVFQ